MKQQEIEKRTREFVIENFLFGDNKDFTNQTSLFER